MRDPNSFLRPLVTNESTVRLPRWVLLSLILAYSISGFVGHEPWKGPEALAFGRALDWLAGSAHWPVDVNVAHMASGLSIEAFASIFGVSTASRIPHMLALLATFAGVWYATFHLAKREQAQPALLPFGGQPHPVDYARCVADAAALGLIA
ncbi:MAG: hypothetical protein N2483_09315, partial [Burkholderiaceae bacterium]|nr:hypothetical protein [Burkholderiaceae bacterium]